MSNVRRLVLSLCKLSIVSGYVRRLSGVRSTAEPNCHICARCCSEACSVPFVGALANRTAASGHAGRRGFEPITPGKGFASQPGFA